MKILSIETSCDETAIALLDASGGIRTPKFKVIKSEVSSQVKIHAPFGGVVPNLAKREHIKNLPIVLKNAIGDTSKVKPDMIAVTVGPGLEPALWAGIEFAKSLKKNVFPKARLIGTNHLEGHLYSYLLSPKLPKTIFPAIALIVSGGHTILLYMSSLSKWKKIGETRDDAVGEAFDKVARVLQLPFPGGPEIEKSAKRGDAKKIDFPRPMIHTKNYDFSFSGLKTAVLYYTRDNKKTKKEDVAASFQKAAIDVLVEKTTRATREYEAHTMLLSGGVAANTALRETLEASSKKLRVNFLPTPMLYNTDNAAMIGVAGYLSYLRKKRFGLKARGTLNM